MRNQLKVLTIGLLVAVFGLAQSAEAASGRVRIGGLSVSGGALELLGSFTTTTGRRGDVTAQYVGWSLIVLGSLVQAGDVANQVDFTYDNYVVYRPMVRESRVSLNHPELTADSGFGFAAREFEDSSAATYEQKAQSFAKVVLAVDQKAKAVKALKAQDASYQVSVDALAQEVLGDKATDKNVHMVTNLFALADII